MPLQIEPPGGSRGGAGAIVIGLVINMPDRALRATERQFTSLLSAASGAIRVQLRLSYLPEVPRGSQACEHIARTYWPIEDLLGDHPAALIVTGTEPVCAALDEEPYWQSMLTLLDWAQSHAASSIWSCLAAHAAVQALDGILRHRLPEKRFGIFEHHDLSDHALLQGVGSPLLTPHSRWNDLPLEPLRAAGFDILSASPECGANVFVRPGRSLLVCFQGHPEYETTTLLKEYRRDIGRFLRAEQTNWPAVPRGYFSAPGLEILERFRDRVGSRRDPALLADFPTAGLTGNIYTGWRPAAVSIYRNWLSHVAAVKERTP